MRKTKNEKITFTFNSELDFNDEKGTVVSKFWVVGYILDYFLKWFPKNHDTFHQEISACNIKVNILLIVFKSNDINIP